MLISYGEEYRIEVPQLSEVVSEVKAIAAVLTHPQFKKLSDVLHEALQKKKDLVIGGDMHPNLARR